MSVSNRSTNEKYISIDILKETFEYVDGKLIWRHRNRNHFSSIRSMQIANAKMTGKVAGTYSKGYLVASINRNRFFVHRAIWAIFNNKWPDNYIDHINHIRDDNRIENLRVVSAIYNSRNCRISKNNTSGINGVTFFKRDNNWRVQIMVDRKNIHIGYYDNLEDARDARKKANSLHGFDENHGEIYERH